MLWVGRPGQYSFPVRFADLAFARASRVPLKSVWSLGSCASVERKKMRLKERKNETKHSDTTARALARAAAAGDRCPRAEAAIQVGKGRVVCEAFVRVRRTRAALECVGTLS